jgi:hypothetical protein
VVAPGAARKRSSQACSLLLVQSTNSAAGTHVGTNGNTRHVGLGACCINPYSHYWRYLGDYSYSYTRQVGMQHVDRTWQGLLWGSAADMLLLQRLHEPVADVEYGWS